ncbi:hypothetical protein SCA6_000591 [Theobroma cacao]
MSTSSPLLLNPRILQNEVPKIPLNSKLCCVFLVQSSAGSLNAKIFTFLASLCLFSFSVGVLTDPGYAPSSYLPDVEDSSSVSDEEPKKNGVQSKYCDKCAAYKPPRAHHCRVCRRCILRMDHHCLWINNCVGYWNYKAFFTLVLYATIGSIHSTVACGAMMVALFATLGTLLGVGSQHAEMVMASINQPSERWS